jgi:hypothetical protein
MPMVNPDDEAYMVRGKESPVSEEAVETTCGHTLRFGECRNAALMCNEDAYGDDAAAGPKVADEYRRITAYDDICHLL